MSTTNGASPDMTVIVGDDFSTLKPKVAEFLPGFQWLIPMRMVTVLAGEPGQGKSMLTLHIAAQLARLGLCSVIAAAEDDVEHILLPRLLGEGLSDEERLLIKFISLKEGGEHGGQILMPSHAHLLRDYLQGLRDEDYRVALLAVDPIGSFVAGQNLNVWKTTDMRLALAPFKLLAEKFNLAVILVAHVSKGTGTNLANRLQDSSAFGQVARSILFLGLDPDDPEGRQGDQRVLASFKSNVGKKPGATSYRIVPMLVEYEGQRFDVPRMECVGASTHNPHDLLGYAARDVKQDDGTSGAPKRTMAEWFLREKLQDGLAHNATELQDEAEERGFSEMTLRRARNSIGVVVSRTGFGAGSEVTWRLP